MGALKLIESLFMLCLGVVFIVMLYLLYHYKDRINALEMQIETLDHTDDVLVEFNGKMAKRLEYFDAQIQGLKALSSMDYSKQMMQAQQQPPLSDVFLRKSNSDQRSEEIINPDPHNPFYSNLVIMRSCPTTERIANEPIDMSDLDDESLELDDDDDDDDDVIRLDLGDEEVSLSTVDDVSGECATNTLNTTEEVENISLDEMVIDVEPSQVIEPNEVKVIVTKPQFQNSFSLGEQSPPRKNQFPSPSEAAGTYGAHLAPQQIRINQVDYNKMAVPDLRKLIVSKALKPASDCIKMKKTDLVQVLQDHDRKSL